MAYFWVRFQYRDTPRSVGFFCGHPEKVWVLVDERLFFCGRCLRAGAGLFGHVEFPVRGVVGGVGGDGVECVAGEVCGVRRDLWEDDWVHCGREKE